MGDKPKAWRSPLREHLAEIRRMRRARHTWQEITDHLANRYGLRLTRSALCHFFRRATRRPLPMGFEDVPANDGTVTELPQANAAQLGADGNSEERTSRNEGISLMPVNQPKKRPWFGWEPDQGINYTPKE